MPQLSQLFVSFSLSLFICQKKNIQKWKNWRYFSGEEAQIETMGGLLHHLPPLSKV